MMSRHYLMPLAVLALTTACNSTDEDSGPAFTHPEGVLAPEVPEISGRPFGVAISRSGLVYVTRLDAAMVTVLDASLAVVDSIDVGSAPTGVAFAPDGETAYVTNQFSQSLGVIDVSTATQVDEIELPADPFVPFVSPDGSKVFVTSNTSNVYVINRGTATLTDSIELSHAPNGFAFHPTKGRVYVSAFAGGTVSEITVSNGDVLRTFTPGGLPQGMAVSRNGRELYVANESGWMEIFDLSTGASARKVTLDSGGFGLALSPDGEFVYVTEPAVGKVQIVSVESRSIVGTLYVGGQPRRIAFTRLGDMAVVANEDGYVSFVK